MISDITIIQYDVTIVDLESGVNVWSVIARFICLLWNHASVTLSFYGRLAGTVNSTAELRQARLWC